MAYQSTRNIVVITQSDMSLTQGRGEFDASGGLFSRVCVYESYGFRRLPTQKLDALKKTDARFRHCASATICHDTLKDVRAMISFLERPEFSAPFDRNVFRNGGSDGFVDDKYVEARRRMVVADDGLDEIPLEPQAVDSSDGESGGMWEYCPSAPDNEDENDRSPSELHYHGQVRVGSSPPSKG